MEPTVVWLELLHGNVKNSGAVFDTVAPGTQSSGTLRRRHARRVTERMFHTGSVAPALSAGAVVNKTAHAQHGPFQTAKS